MAFKAHTYPIIVALGLLVLSCAKEDFSEVATADNETNASIVITDYTPLANTVIRGEVHSLDLDQDGVQDISLRVSRTMNTGLPNDRVQITYLSTAWESVYDTYVEETEVCESNTKVNGRISYKSNQQEIDCNTATFSEKKKKVFLSINPTLSDYSESAWNQSIKVLAYTTNTQYEDQGYFHHYHSGDWYGNNGIAMFRNSTSKAMVQVQISVPRAYTVSNGIRIYQIPEVSYQIQG